MPKAQHNADKKSALPLRNTGKKQAPADLAEFIRLANLVPTETWLPVDLTLPRGMPFGWAALLEGIQDLPESVRSELIEGSKQPKPATEEMSVDDWRIGSLLSHYAKIVIAYYNLRGLTRGTGGDIEPSTLNELLIALGNADLSYLRQCRKVGCGRIFYAGKHTQQGCSVEHSNALRQQRKRDNDKAEREARKELAAGKKRAKKASKR